MRESMVYCIIPSTGVATIARFLANPYRNCAFYDRGGGSFWYF